MVEIQGERSAGVYARAVHGGFLLHEQLQDDAGEVGSHMAHAVKQHCLALPVRPIGPLVSPALPFRLLLPLLEASAPFLFSTLLISNGGLLRQGLALLGERDLGLRRGAALL